MFSFLFFSWSSRYTATATDATTRFSKRRRTQHATAGCSWTRWATTTTTATTTATTGLGAVSRGQIGRAQNERQSARTQLVQCAQKHQTTGHSIHECKRWCGWCESRWTPKRTAFGTAFSTTAQCSTTTTHETTRNSTTTKASAAKSSNHRSRRPRLRVRRR